MAHEGHEHGGSGHDGDHPGVPGDSPSAQEHKSRAPSQVSTYGHPICGHRVVTDDPEAIRSAIQDAGEAGARAVILNGGTGIGRRDNAVEVLEGLLEKRLPGFGELFRYLSFKQIGSAAMMSRAVAGTYRGMILFALPGSPQAAGLAMDALILPELGHAVRELTR